MKKELKKRIITSILLFSLVIFCIFINWPIYILFIIIVSGIVLSEIVNLILLVEKSASTKNWIPFRLISFFYIFFMFFPLAGAFYALGEVFIIYILLICIFSDIGGYIIGKTIGGKKLTKISPKKTISGSIGSFCFWPPVILQILLFLKFDFCLTVSLILVVFASFQ